MEKIGIGIIISILLMACESTADNKEMGTEKLIEQVQLAEQTEMLEDGGVAEVIVVEEKEAGEVNNSKESKILIKELVENKPLEVDVEKKEPELDKTQVAQLIEKPNHDIWNSLTMQNVTADGQVDYKAIKADINQLVLYLSHLEQTPPKDDWSKNDKLAYWINLYNASTVYLIASNYPVKSITKLSGGKPWDKKFVKSGVKVYTLNQVENEIIRPRFKDPRIHAALNCAAVSCPKLLNGAYFSSILNAQLDGQTRAWINDKTKNKLSGNKAQVSQIFDWYKADFKDGVVAFINKYISTGVALEKKAKITYLEYDWALNE